MSDEMMKMELHEVRNLNTKEAISIMRVVGGWVYTFYCQINTGDFVLSHCFVPEAAKGEG